MATKTGLPNLLMEAIVCFLSELSTLSKSSLRVKWADEMLLPVQFLALNSRNGLWFKMSVPIDLLTHFSLGRVAGLYSII